MITQTIKTSFCPIVKTMSMLVSVFNIAPIYRHQPVILRWFADRIAFSPQR